VSEQSRPPLSPKGKLAVAWIGAGLTLVALLGLIVVPGIRLVWIVLLVFGVLAIPQVLLFDCSHRKPDKRDEPRR